jgi:hypothetical protein
MEHSPCCLCCGKIGLGCADRNRKRIFAAGILLNLFAMFLAILSAVGGLSTSGGVMTAIPWVYGKGTMQQYIGAIEVEVHVGITARYDVVDCASAFNGTECESVLSSLGFEHTGGQTYERSLEWRDEFACETFNEQETQTLCENCRDDLVPKSTLIVGILTQLPTIATDLQRATRFGDVNCQATLGFLTNVVSLVSTMTALLAFRWSCWHVMPDTLGNATMEWHLGIGFRCLILATLIKVFDAAFHAIVPTPREKWEKPPKDITDVADYMALSAPSQEAMSVEDDVVVVRKVKESEQLSPARSVISV